MKLKSLTHYVKDNVEKLDGRPRSVLIRKDQIEFLNSRDINLSKLVRDVLDEMMSTRKPK